MVSDMRMRSKGVEPGAEVLSKSSPFFGSSVGSKGRKRKKRYKSDGC